MKLIIYIAIYFSAFSIYADEKTAINTACEAEKLKACDEYNLAENKKTCLDSAWRNLSSICLERRHQYIQDSKDRIQSTLSSKFDLLGNSGKQNLIEIKTNLDEVRKINETFGPALKKHATDIQEFAKNYRDVFVPSLNAEIPHIEAMIQGASNAKTSSNLTSISTQIKAAFLSQFTEIDDKLAELRSLKFRTSYIKDSYLTSISQFEIFAKSEGLVIEDNSILLINQVLNKLEEKITQRRDKLNISIKHLNETLDRKLNSLVASEVNFKVDNATRDATSQERRNNYRKLVDKHVLAFQSKNITGFQSMPFQAANWAAMKELSTIIEFCKITPTTDIYSLGCLRALQFEKSLLSQPANVESFIIIVLEHLDSSSNPSQTELRKSINQLLAEKNIDDAVIAYDKLLDNLSR